MSLKATLIAAILVLLLGVTAVALVNMGKGDPSAEETAESGVPSRSGEGSDSGRFTPDQPETEQAEVQGAAAVDDC